MPSPIDRYQDKIVNLGVKHGYPTLFDDVRQAVASSSAVAFCHDGAGLLVVKPVHRDGQLGVFVWLAIGQCDEAFATYLPFVVHLAQSEKARFIEFETKRKGFKRLATKHNFTQTRLRDGFFVFTKEVV